MTSKTAAAEIIATFTRQIASEYGVEITDELIDRIVKVGFSSECPNATLAAAVRAYPARTTIHAAL